MIVLRINRLQVDFAFMAIVLGSLHSLGVYIIHLNGFPQASMISASVINYNLCKYCLSMCGFRNQHNTPRSSSQFVDVAFKKKRFLSLTAVESLLYRKKDTPIGLLHSKLGSLSLLYRILSQTMKNMALVILGLILAGCVLFLLIPVI